MSFKDVMKKCVSKMEAVCGAYASAMDKTEEKIMSTCGSERTMDEVVGDYASRGWTKTKKAGVVVVEKTTTTTTMVVEKVKEKAPLVVVAVKEKVASKKPKDVLARLAQDKDLAAALRYVYLNPCIKVDVKVLDEGKVINCDGRAPMVRTGVEDNAAAQAGTNGGLDKPGPMSMMARVKSFVKRGVSTPLVTIN